MKKWLVVFTLLLSSMNLAAQYKNLKTFAQRLPLRQTCFWDFSPRKNFQCLTLFLPTLSVVVAAV